MIFDLFFIIPLHVLFNDHLYSLVANRYKNDSCGNSDRSVIGSNHCLSQWHTQQVTNISRLALSALDRYGTGVADHYDRRGGAVDRLVTGRDDTVLNAYDQSL